MLENNLPKEHIEKNSALIMIKLSESLPIEFKCLFSRYNRALANSTSRDHVMAAIFFNDHADVLKNILGYEVYCKSWIKLEKRSINSDLNIDKRISPSFVVCYALLNMESFFSMNKNRKEGGDVAIRIYKELNKTLSRLSKQLEIFRKDWAQHFDESLFLNRYGALIRESQGIYQEHLEFLDEHGPNDFRIPLIPLTRQSDGAGRPKLTVIYLNILFKILFGTPLHETVSTFVNGIYRTNYTAKDVTSIISHENKNSELLGIQSYIKTIIEKINTDLNSLGVI